MTGQLTPSQERIFTALFALSVIALISFTIVFFVLCSSQDLSSTTDNVASPILGQFDSTGAAIVIIGMPILFILMCHLYLKAYRM
jgi:hypothetical protein